ncbi:glutathione S-transferase family protein [Bordetella sp. N]|uniref:glutathione S-transferase family protein n=1 Tax=Bordetella sp. N TaxID=1746199 RepID=UPI0007104B3A|nr:glutathione S-transferase family protein [Bordetella sp. N]ALM85603.1 glutathione S-transferase [Bordetella sp. N]
MKLLYAPTSPFVRKVMVCALITGLADRIQWLDSAAHPINRDARIAAHNPLAKVPTLILDDGPGLDGPGLDGPGLDGPGRASQALYDSRVICEYLADLAGNAHLFPPAGAKRWTALTQQATGDGLLDAALLARYEHTARPEDKQWTAWREAQLVKVQAALATIETLAPSLQCVDPSIGDITLGCALGYLDFRYPELDWRADHPLAAKWFAAFNALPAMQATLPHA